MSKPRNTSSFDFTLPKLKGVSGLRSPRGWGAPRSGARQKAPGFTSPPQDWWRNKYPGGTEPQYQFFQALTQLGFREGTDFYFRFPVAGIKADFVFPSRNLVILLKNAFQTSDSDATNQALFVTTARMQQAGLSVVTVSELSAMSNPIITAKNALEGIGTA